MVKNIDCSAISMHQAIQLQFREFLQKKLYVVIKITLGRNYYYQGY